MVGPNLLLLREAVLQSSSVLEDLARKQREEAVARAMADYESRRKAAHELEDSRLQEVDALIAAAIQSVAPVAQTGTSSKSWASILMTLVSRSLNLLT